LGGFVALGSNTEGEANTATGIEALRNNTTGGGNTATGYEALFHNNADNNTATGSSALFANTMGVGNTATGALALQGNSTGDNNTANGFAALSFNSTGSNNTAVGYQAFFSNRTGNKNTANGVNALFSNISGNNNTAEGFGALEHSVGSNNVAIGVSAGNSLTTGGNNIDIGTNVVGIEGEANTIRIGKFGIQQKTFVAGIFGKTVTGGVTEVVINSNGQLGTVVSSARFKEAIKPMDKASEAILALKPVTFRYKKELDPDKIPQFGLIAEEVEKVNPELVARDEKGKIMSVRYEAVNAMLLNEFLKEHGKVEKLETTIALLQKQVEALTAGLQKVSAQLELNKPAPRTALNNP
jgi:hypothetical protein